MARRKKVTEKERPGAKPPDMTGSLNGTRLEIKPDFVEAHCNLGNALAGRGQVDEAIAHLQKALSPVSARTDTALADAIRARIRHLQSVAPAGKAQ